MLKYLFLFLFTATLWADDYIIEKFGGSDDFPGEPDEFIKAEFANQLKKANPNAIQDTRFYLRQKFEDPFEELVTYQLYEGTASASKGTLSKFKSEEISYTELMKKKVYINEGGSADEDLEKVYFDGQFLYVEGERNLFVKHMGRMVALKSSEEREFNLEISSSPGGAEVIISEEVKGKTPLSFKVLGADPVILTLRKSGFYDVIKVLTPVAGKNVQDGALLIPKAELENPATPFKLRLLEYGNNNDKPKIIALRDEITQAIDEFPTTSKETINEILNNYPPNPGQATGESSQNYQARTTLWERNRSSEETRLESASERYLEQLKDLLPRLENTLSSISDAAPAPVYTPEPEPVEEETYESFSEQIKEDENKYDPKEDEEQFSQEQAQYAQQDEAVDEAVGDIDDRFGVGDEYQEWAAWTLAVVGIATGVVGYLEHMEVTKADEAYTSSSTELDEAHKTIRESCQKLYPNDAALCQDAINWDQLENNPDPNGYLPYITNINQMNKTTLDSYTNSRNLFLLISGVSLVGSVTLFVVKF